MSIFGPTPLLDANLRTFAPPAAPAAQPLAPPEPRALERLLVAATQADVAQAALLGARERYRRAPSAARLGELMRAAADALDKEIAFDELWETLSKGWFEERAPQ